MEHQDQFIWKYSTLGEMKNDYFARHISWKVITILKEKKNQKNKQADWLYDQTMISTLANLTSRPDVTRLYRGHERILEKMRPW